MGMIFLRNRVSGAAPADAYAIGGASPELVAAFTTQSDGTTAGEYYRKAGSETTFSGLFTHSVSGPLTMFDSSGTLCWNPHNYTLYNDDLSNAAWTKSGLTVTADAEAALGGSSDKLVSSAATTTMRLIDTATGAGSVQHTLEVVAKADGFDWLLLWQDGPNKGVFFDVANGATGTAYAGATGTIAAAGDGYYRCRMVIPSWASHALTLWISNANGSLTITGDGTSGVLVRSIALYRSDLPMADNPDAPAGLEKHVPTTTAAVYGPRRQAYRYNSGWELAGMQMEAAAATNLHPTSNDFTTNWTNQNSTETAGATTGPDDLTSGTKLVETTANNYHGILNYVAAVGRVTCSIHVKDAGDSRYLIGRFNSSGDFYVVFDPVTGNFTENANGSANITNTSYGAIRCKDGWWRVYMSANVATSINAPYWGLSNTSTPGASLYTYAGTTGAGLFIYGAQTEAGELSSYIPTAGSTVTRAAETLSIAGANNPITATAATFFYDMLYTTPNIDPYAKPLEIEVSANKRFRIYDGSSAQGGYAEWFNDPGVDYNDAYSGASGSFPGTNVRRRGCVSIAENDELLHSANGTTPTPTATTTIADLSGQQIKVGTRLTTRDWIGFIREIRVGSFKTSAADAATVTTL